MGTSLSVRELRSSEDAFVGDLFKGATNYGAVFLEAIYPRSFVDLNRSPFELDPKLVKGSFQFETSKAICSI